MPKTMLKFDAEKISDFGRFLVDLNCLRQCTRSGPGKGGSVQTELEQEGIKNEKTDPKTS